MNRKYSKSSDFYLSTLNSYFKENDKFLYESMHQNQLYAMQPKRLDCKLCSSKLPTNIDFHSHGVGYIFCEECSHLNGAFQDTKEFTDKLYVSDSGTEYSECYIDENFTNRVSVIYSPKVDFLKKNIPLDQFKILDVGCGCGYFVLAAQLEKLEATGLDVSQSMIDFGNLHISHLTGSNPLSFVSETDFYDSVIHSDANVISAIGVIEHLREPHKFFDAFRKSSSQYLYYSVPMFSFSAVLENISHNVFPRQLSGGHTHLFTEQSILKMNEIIRIESIAEWRFGSDAMDLYRHMLINLQKNNASPKVIDYFINGFGNKIDEIQASLDKNYFCSEIHTLAIKI